MPMTRRVLITATGIAATFAWARRDSAYTTRIGVTPDPDNSKKTSENPGDYYFTLNTEGVNSQGEPTHADFRFSGDIFLYRENGLVLVKLAEHYNIPSYDMGVLQGALAQLDKARETVIKKCPKQAQALANPVQGEEREKALADAFFLP